MVKKFKITLMNIEQGVFTHVFEVNCANEDQAIGIVQGLFNYAKVIDIEEVI